MTALDPRAAAMWRASRAPLLVGAFVIVIALVIATLSARPPVGLLNPEAVDGSGGRALARLLTERGVTVTLTRDAGAVGAAGPAATVLVPFPQLLSANQLAALRRSGADLVLVAPNQEALAALAPGVELTTLRAPTRTREPRCELPAARAAGTVELGGHLYRAAGGLGCYPDEPVAGTGPGGGDALVRVSVGARAVTMIGEPGPLTNGSLASEGNAALALRLLGAKPTLLWYMPGLEAPAAGEERDLEDLVPPGWRWAVAQLWVAAAVAVLWRSRRLGPVVREPLPVVVRAIETVRGRARLYRRAQARGHAAETLRAAVRIRLAGLVGLGRGDGPEPAALVRAVGARTGRAGSDVEALLYGPAPEDDAALVELADRLDNCEREVRRT
ncbi:DUF4350 domain-containing protein [Pseudonocardia acaciae]|uniref:DUF4350 domain-containing protein n=1 Tax=Pseudonocardia acaciae TaxID=551276 RepID=UPI00048ADC7C|nr:DUF4350 domain-containing protein [Pseudonocardia acaciae]